MSPHEVCDQIASKHLTVTHSLLIAHWLSFYLPAVNAHRKLELKRRTFAKLSTKLSTNAHSMLKHPRVAGAKYRCGRLKSTSRRSVAAFARKDPGAKSNNEQREVGHQLQEALNYAQVRHHTPTQQASRLKPTKGLSMLCRTYRLQPKAMVIMLRKNGH